MAPDPRQLRSQRFPLHAAVENGDVPRVRGLLEGAMGSQVNRKYETSGQTPLHIAASSGCPAIIQLLLDAGAAVGKRAAGSDSVIDNGCLQTDLTV